MRFKKRYLLNIILLFLAVVLLLEIFLPGMAEDRLRDILKARTTSIEDLDVSVSSFPALKILAGRVDQVTVEGKGVLFNNLYLDILSLHYQDILLGKNSFIGENTKLDIIIREKALNDYIQANYPELDSFIIKLNPDQVYLQGKVKIFETKVNLQLAGRLVIEEENVVSFNPDNFQLEDINIPVSLLRSLMKDMGFSFDLEELEIPIRVDTIDINKGKLQISGNESIRKAAS